MNEMKVVESRPAGVRAVETFIEDYRPLTPQDVRNLERQAYADFRDGFRADPVRVMVEASDLGMDLGQYANLRAPDTRVEQGRSIMSRLMEEEGIYVRSSDMSQASTVGECLDGAHRQALLFDTLTKAWEKGGIQSQDRGSITLQTSTPIGTSPNLYMEGMPAPVAVGLRLNPGELVATTHSITTNTYNPYFWVYDREAMQRTKVRPAELIPASTLGERSGNIPMDKWGNRFVLPYEMLTGGQSMRINKLAQMVMLDSVTETVRQYEELLKILESGDGVTGAAVVEGITTYGGTASTFDLASFTNWLDEAMSAPFQISHCIMTSTEQRSLRSSVAGFDATMIFQVLSSVGLSPSGLSNMESGNMAYTGQVRYGRAPDGAVTSGRILGIDSRFAVEKVNRAGMMIRQQAEQIANQTREVVVSDTYLFARLAPEAVSVLNISA